MPKILTLDIETKPAMGYVWGLFDQNISLNQLISPSAPICVGMKWLGQKKVYIYSDWKHGHVDMIKNVFNLVSEADAIVTYNGNRFDLPKLQGEFALAGLGAPPPVTSIDLLKDVKKLGFQSNKLAYIGPLLGIGEKVKNAGFELWDKVMQGDKTAQKEMESYCAGDVQLTEDLYVFMKPFIKNHPFLGEGGKGSCGACESTNLHNRGYRFTKAFKIQRVQCQDCGSWQDGTRKKI